MGDTYRKTMTAYNHYMQMQRDTKRIDTEPEFLVIDLASNFKLQKELDAMRNIAPISIPTLGVSYGVKFRGIRIAIARIAHDEKEIEIIKFVGGYGA